MSDEIKYEDAVKELDEIVSKLENGTVSLDESIKLFERGTKLAGICSDKLKRLSKRLLCLLRRIIMTETEFKNILTNDIKS